MQRLGGIDEDRNFDENVMALQWYVVKDRVNQ
jgi:hypothetical protein